MSGDLDRLVVRAACAARGHRWKDHYVPHPQFRFTCFECVECGHLEPVVALLSGEPGEQGDAQ